MPDIQQLLEIALRHSTAMADAMILACFKRAHEMGRVLVAPKRRSAPAAARGERPTEDVDWERMVRANSDTALNHC